MNLQKNKWFTLIEVMVAVMLMALVLIAIYSTFQAIMLHQLRLQTEIDLHTHAYYATEKFVTLLEDGGSIDYEEHWNRKVLGDARSWVNDTYDYSIWSQLGNTTNPYIYCGSNFVLPASSHQVDNNNIPIDQAQNIEDTDNCFDGRNNRRATSGASINLQIGSDKSAGQSQYIQKYGQYQLFHIDVNHQQDANYGEEDFSISANGWTDYNPIETEGIAQIGYTNGPSVLTDFQEEHGSSDIFLIKHTNSGIERTFFRHIYRQDPFPASPTCDPIDLNAFYADLGNPDYTLLEGCLGSIQITKLRATDVDNDGQVDWWIPHPDYAGIGTEIISGVYPDVEWVDVFPEYVNVLDARFYIHPPKNQEYVGASSGSISIDENLVHPYVDMRLTLGIGNEKSHIFTNLDPRFQFHTTINLD